MVKRSNKHLFGLPSLMSRSGQQFFVFMLPHLFSSFFDYASQAITSNLNLLIIYCRYLIFFFLSNLFLFFLTPGSNSTLKMVPGR